MSLDLFLGAGEEVGKRRRQRWGRGGGGEEVEVGKRWRWGRGGGEEEVEWDGIVL